MSYGFVEGCTIGFMYAAPIGPVAILCLRRTLAENWLSGVVSGMGSATAIALYSILIVLSVNSVADVLKDYHFWLHMLGGMFLCYVGVRILLARPSHITNTITKKSYSRCFMTTFVLAFVMALPDLTFPIFVLNWMAGISSTNTYNPMNFSLGVLISEVLWWLTFCSLCWALRLHFKPKLLRWINYVSGGAIASFGITTVLTPLLP
ncbi:MULTISPECIES: LysE family transporter [unclassified Leptolyngbya]|uniref:LysE family translocator n=1 Tax=unclassified Leptolyngbya TaxID=2650499 RepID=UPI0016879C3F|nr:MULTISPECIES: LysE family transporter [unclassified Leptolyngbya]MBD1910095.1 LysE family transporter [Leptolyngbya sp. FACHB-8]MBD2156867.1 LysE family transporter [Leptolyngbya sp. FACHB-16]